MHNGGDDKGAAPTPPSVDGVDGKNRSRGSYMYTSTHAHKQW